MTNNYFRCWFPKIIGESFSEFVDYFYFFVCVYQRWPCEPEELLAAYPGPALRQDLEGDRPGPQNFEGP